MFNVLKKFMISHEWMNDQSGGSYNINKQIIFKTPMLQSDLCNYSDAYIVVKGTINFTDPNNDAHDKKLAFKNNAPFINSISKINNTLIGNAEYLDFVMLMYNFLEYSKNYSKATESFWNYYRDEPSSGTARGVNHSIRGSKVFDWKTSITEKLEGNNTEKENVEIVAPLKYLSSFWRTLDKPLINCEINLILTWTENCVLRNKATRDTDPDADPSVSSCS